MKNSAVLASLLFGACAVAAPFDKRALVYATSVVTETVVIYTTVYEDEPATSSTEGLFYEQPTTTAVEVAPTSSSAPAYTPPAATEEPSSVYTPPPQTSSTTPTPTPTPEPVTTEAAQPTTTEAAQPTTTEEAAAPATTTAAAASQASTGTTTSTGETFSNVDITVYDNAGGYGACGTQLYDTDMIVALAQGSWGSSTYDVMTGAATNPNCGQKIQIDYNGKTAQATIMDLCPGCTGANDIDLSRAVWAALGLSESTRLKASWSKIA